MVMLGADIIPHYCCGPWSLLQAYGEMSQNICEHTTNKNEASEMLRET